MEGIHELSELRGYQVTNKVGDGALYNSFAYETSAGVQVRINCKQFLSLTLARSASSIER